MLVSANAYVISPTEFSRKYFYNKGGYSIEIKNFDGANINCIIRKIQSPPYNRIAEAEVSGKVINNKFDFTYDEDGWGDSGKGSMEFSGDQIKVKIEILKQKDLIDGMVVFHDWDMCFDNIILVKGND